MTPTIRIDDDLYEFLKEHAEPFVDTPNAVLRRLLELPHSAAAEADAAPFDGTSTEEETTPPRLGSTAKSRRQRGSRARTRAPRAASGTLLEMEAYELPLLEVLKEKGGSAPSRDVLDALGERLDGKLTDVDKEEIGTGGLRWRNRAQFARLELVKKGDMASDSPRGVWEITDQGRGRVEGNVR